MAAEFEQVLKETRLCADQMRFLAAQSFEKDAYPEFWRYASDLSARWSDALSEDSLDWGVLGKLREEARTEKQRAGIWLFAWCNGIETDYLVLRESSLTLTKPDDHEHSR